MRREREAISRIHAGWVGGRDCPLRLMEHATFSGPGGSPRGRCTTPPACSWPRAVHGAPRASRRPCRYVEKWELTDEGAARVHWHHFVLCPEPYFHARDARLSVHTPQEDARMWPTRAALARMIAGRDSFDELAPEPFSSAPRVPRKALLFRQERGAIRPPMHAVAVRAGPVTTTISTSPILGPGSGPGRPRPP